MTKRRNPVIEDFEVAVTKRALASKDGAHGPYDVEIAEILYLNAKSSLEEYIASKNRLIAQLSRSSH